MSEDLKGLAKENAQKLRGFENSIYKDWANHHLAKTGVKRVIEDLPKDISDGVVLAEIVEFICGKPVEKIHSKPRTTKQKLHNLEKCLQALEKNRVVLNDVTVQGLFRADLKCVLALFFHLSRFKQKEKDFNMADISKSSQKRCLRPPSTVGVGRKSLSFNANDRNRIKLNLSSHTSQSKSKPSTPVDDAPKSVASSQNRTSIAQSSAQGWRSKSMNVKHTATTKLVAPRPVGPTMQTFKPDLTKSTQSATSKDHSKIAGTMPKKPANAGRLPSCSSRLQPLAKKPQVATNGVSVKLRNDGSNKITLDKSVKSTSLTRTSARSTISASKSPQRSLERPEAQTSVCSIPSVTMQSESKTSKTEYKPNSVMSRLRKFGSHATTNVAASNKSRPVSATKTGLRSVSPTSTIKKRAGSCPPTSRLDTRSSPKHKKEATSHVITQPNHVITQPNQTMKTTNQDKSLKSQPVLKSVKSSIGQALRSSKSVEKKSPNSSRKKSGAAGKGSRKSVITKNEICPIIPMLTDAKQPVGTMHTRSSGIAENLVTSLCEELSLMHDHVAPINLTSVDQNSSKPTISQEHFVKPVSISVTSSRDLTRPHKTAMVAPIIRQAATLGPAPIENIEKSSIDDVTSAELEDITKPTTLSTVESREMAVKGISDLRQNLEATMNSLRSAQSGHQHHGNSPRRKSAQLDNESFKILDCQLSRNSATYRSHHNLTSSRTRLHASLTSRSNSPKLLAGETLAHRIDYKFLPDQYSSLQRTRSARYPRLSWGEKPDICESATEAMKSSSGTQNKSDDDASDSSGNLSDFIGDLSTDEFSSNNNSPQHQMKTQNPTESNEEQRKNWAKLGNRLSKSSMDIDGGGKTLKYLKRKAMAKQSSGLPSTAGSSVVGSRLASAQHSPCPSPSQHSASNVRGVDTYRSLPRPAKTKISETRVSSPSQLSEKSSPKFNRSPSLQKLFGYGKSKQNFAEANDGISTILSNPHVAFSSSKTTTKVSAASCLNPNSKKIPSDDSNSLARRDNYSSLGRPGRASSGQHPISYMSLPRKHRAHFPAAMATTSNKLTSAMTWAPPKRSNPNSAYSITPADTANPYIDLLDSPSLNIDNQDAMNFADPDVLSQTDPELLKREVSDWPLPTLVSSSVAAASTSSAASKSSENCDVSSKTKTYLDKGRYPSSILSSTSSLYSNKEHEYDAEENLESQIFSHVKSVSAFEDNLSGIENNFRHLTKEAHAADFELQELKQNIESRIKTNSIDGQSNASTAVLRKKASNGSVTSINSAITASSVGSNEDGSKKKKKHWLRESLKTAFSKRKSRTNLATDLEEEPGIESLREEDEDSEMVAQLKQELLMKERKLTDIRLEALTSQHQLHQMQDAMHKMKSEIEILRQENERLNKLGLDSGSCDVQTDCASTCSSFSITDRFDKGDKRLLIKVQLPDHMIQDDTDERTGQSVIGICCIASSIGWLELDTKVQSVFQNFCKSVSPCSLLGLDPSSILSYKLGEALREIDGDIPDLLPCGYLIRNEETLVINLKDGNVKSCDSLAFELLTDRDMVEQYVRLVLDHGRVMLSGPPGTGKTTLANRLAEHVVRINPKSPGIGKIVRLDLKYRNENEVVDYLHQLSEDCSKPESSGKNIPVVLLLDGLHRSTKLKEAIVPLLTTAAHSQLPYLIGVAEKNCNSGLELHQEFRWILCANHTSPVQDYLGRLLRQCLCRWKATSTGRADDVIDRVVFWLPECWKHINKCIESYNSADVTLGPRLFTACPMNGQQSLSWFTNLWNFSIVPYIISAVKQGSRRRGSVMEWIDPLDWVKESWPWNSSCSLLPIRAEDVASDHFSGSNPHSVPNLSPQHSDPLLNMMLKLREAASSYESDASHEESFERNLDKALGDLS